MPSCSAQRIDHLDLNASSSQNVSRICSDGNDTMWFFYDAVTIPANGLSRRVFVRQYTISTNTMGPPVQVSDSDAQGDTFPQAVRLSDGTLICIYRWQVAPSGVGSAGLKAHESTDGGATWSASVILPRISPDSDNWFLHPYGLDTDGVGTIVAMASMIGSADDTYIWQRTAPGIWSIGPTLIFNGSSTNGWFFTDNSARDLLVIDSQRACVVGSRQHSGHVLTLSGLYSLNTALLTWQEIATPFYSVPSDLGTTTAGLKMQRGTDQRIRVQWVDTANFPQHQMFIGYSDDAGATWTTLGAPLALVGPPWSANYGHAIALDSANQHFIAGTFFGDPLSIPYRIFKGGDDLASWTKVLDCTLTNPFNQLITAGPVGESIFVGTNHYFVGSYGTTGPSVNHIMLISVPGIGTNGVVCPVPPCPPPPPPPPPCPGPAPCVIFSPPPPPVTGAGIFRRGVIRQRPVEHPQGNMTSTPLEELRGVPWKGIGDGV